jgi:hypothetical protein
LDHRADGDYSEPITSIKYKSSFIREALEGITLLKGVGFIFAYGFGTLLCSIFHLFAQITKKKDVQASGHYRLLAAFRLHNHKRTIISGNGTMLEFYF